MTLEEIIQKIDNSITELNEIKKQLINFQEINNNVLSEIRMRELFPRRVGYSGMGVRVYNVLSANDYLDLSVSEFIMKCSPKQFSTYRNISKKSIEYMKRVMEYELSLEWE